MRYRFGPGVWWFDDGRSLLGGSPARLFRLAPAGASAVGRWRRDGADDGDDGDGATAAERALIGRLVDAGALHPVAGGGVAVAADVDVVVPVRDRPDALARCLASLRGSGVGRIVVVDDGSLEPAATATAAVARRFGAEVRRHRSSRGPAAARLTGEAATTAALVAFVDSDVAVTPGWLVPLLGLFGDERVALVAPRVRHSGTATALDRYEAARSPIDLGATAGPIAARTRIGYAPAAALVVRRRAFAEVGGFDASMEVGEDVDLVWRLVAAGWRCRYEPASVVAHHGRSSWSEVLARRVDYGRSAAPLAERHPGAVAPVRASAVSASATMLAAAGHPAPAAAVVMIGATRLAVRLGRSPGAAAVAARAVALGQASAAEQMARATVRPWLPAALVLAATGRRGRRWAAVSALAPPAIEWWRRRPAVSLPAWIAFSLADDAAYSAGVWAGAVRHRSPAALLPELGWRGPQRKN